MSDEIPIIAASMDYSAGFWQALDIVARARAYLLFTEAPPREKTDEFVASIIEKGWSQFYALDGDEVVGWCDIIPGVREGLTHVGHLGMGILPDHRGRGIGSRLMETTIPSAFSKAITRIELEVFSTNERAIHLYQKFGFEVEGRKRKARFMDGQYQDFIMMARLQDES